MRLLGAVLAALLLLRSGSAIAQVANPDPAAILADRIEQDGQGNTIVAARVENAEPVFFAHGLLAAGGPAADATTVFEIGSISKVFTSLLLAQLVLDGTMALDRPVSDYLPEGTAVPDFRGKPITLFDLATHSAGLPPIPPEVAAADPANTYPAYSEPMLLAFLAGFELPTEPGTQYAYSNTGFALLGAAIAHAADRPYAELVAGRILEPLGMGDTGLLADGEHFATGHDGNGAPVPHWDWDVFAAAGGYRSTAADMARFVAAASGQVATPLAPAFRLMLERTRPTGSPNTQIGLGLMIIHPPDGSADIVWHNGRTGGFNAFIGWTRDQASGAVVLTNQLTPTGIEDIGFHLLHPALPLAPQPPRREAVAIDPALLQRYPGRYRLGPEFELTVVREGDRLFVQATGQGRAEVFPSGPTEFFYRVVDATISFELDAEGQATGLVLHQNGQDIPGAKM